MERFKEAYKKCELFKGVEEELIIPVLKCLQGKIREYFKDEVIFKPGAKANYVGIILKGNVQVSRMDFYGNRSILGDFYMGDIFGETYAAAGAEVLPVEVKAVERTHIMLIDIKRIISPCSHPCRCHQRMTLNLISVLARKNLLISRKNEIISKRKTKGRLLDYLSKMAIEKGTNSFKVPFDRQELADYLEVDRSGLCTEIVRLKKDGILKVEGKKFTILKQNISNDEY